MKLTRWTMALALGAVMGIGPAMAEESSIADQKDVAITVYNNNLALVKDRRAVKLGQGEVSLTFMDVAQQIRPETVSLRSVAEPGSLRIVEQNYEFDLMSPEKLMEKYVGKKVTLTNFYKEISTTPSDAYPQSVEAELLSVNNGPIYKVGEKIYLGHPGNVVLPEIPGNLIAKPSLIWLLDNQSADQDLEVTYLTNGIQWTADYVVTLMEKDSTMNVEGWVTLNNQSGAQYTNAQLKLVAGEVNIAPQPMAAPMVMESRAKMAGAAVMDMAQESFSEYHLYTLPRRTTIKENQSKQVSLLSAAGIKARKVYEYRGEQYYFFQQIGQMKDQKVASLLKFKNEEANQLGIPLPGGVMRVYQEDSSGSLQFSGEDRIQHTPKDEEITLKLGNAFDIVADRTQTDYKIISTNVYESAYEIEVRNHKDADIQVDIVEPMTSDWRILEKSNEFVKRDAFTAVFSVNVPKNGSTKVTYRVQVRN